MLALQHLEARIASQLLSRSLQSFSFASLHTQRDNDAPSITQSYGKDAYTITINDKGVQIHPSHAYNNTTQPQQSSSLHSALQRQLSATFLPTGYPSTVAPGYLKYVWWQAAHHCAGSANGVLASTFLLYSVGLGAGAIPTAGALNWVLKDGLGQLGTLLFGRAIAHNFDVASRLWYILASAKLNIAIGLEVCSFLAPQHFLLIASLSNALKGLAWMAGGSSRSAFNVTFATDNNIADITAKATSQTICTSLIGTTGGIVLASYIGQSMAVALPCYSVLAGVHMWTGWESARCVPLATLNPSRMQLLLRRFLVAVGVEHHHHQQHSDSDNSSTINTSTVLLLPTPADVAGVDPIFPTTTTTNSNNNNIKVGSSLKHIAANHPLLLAQLWPLFKTQKHILQPIYNNTGTNSTSNMDGKKVIMHVVLHEDATANDCLLGMLHATLLTEQLDQNPTRNTTTSSKDSSGISDDVSLVGVVEESLKEAKRLLPQFVGALQAAGWDVNKVVLESKRHRAVW